MYRLISGDIVTVVVGSEPKVYHLHRNLICHHSASLLVLIDVLDRTGKSYLLELLLKFDKRAFDIFVHWLYRGSLPVLPDRAESYIKVYGMAETCRIAPLQDAVCDYLQQLRVSQFQPLEETIQVLYAHTSPGCLLRKLLVQALVC